MLNEDQIEALRKQYREVGVIDFYGHQIVFRKPSRDDCRNYRRMQDSAAEKPDCLDSLGQLIVVAVDGEQQPVRCREQFNLFLEDFPLFMNSPKALAVVNILTGMVEVEDAEDLGKGVSVRRGPPKSSQKDSQTGSATARVQPRS